MLVVKNALLHKAMESLETDYSPLYDCLKGSTTIMFSNTGNAPAKLIKEFKKNSDLLGFKAAYVEESFYGADQLDALVAIKSKNELIADVIALLQSPAEERCIGTSIKRFYNTWSIANSIRKIIF